MAVIDAAPGLPFATDAGGHRTGRPLRADACQCPQPAIDEDTCLWCGHSPQELIDDTFARRAQEIQALGRTSRSRGAYLTRNRVGC